MITVMRYGVTMFVTDETIDIVTLAKAAEERGFNSVWLPEHTHIPTTRKTPHPSGTELPEYYKRCLDPFVALTAAAIAAPTLRVGTGILLAAQRDPIVTAKAAASLDLVTGGRFAMGVGYGWNEDEMNDHGVDYAKRRAMAREHVLTMQRLWADDVASFQGDFVDLPPSWAWPKPVQRPVPVLLGGAAGPKLFAAIADYAQGWIPIGGKGITAAVPQLQEAVASAGRDPSTLEIVPFGSTPDHGKLDHFESVGVTECVFNLPSAGEDRVLALLDDYGKLIAAR
jgi:probable F420-dependent oxidoreductase